ncbi:DUF397 domain-containing protein [Spirillospora sp. NPDC050679]
MSLTDRTRAAWRKSSHSGDETNKAQCVELAGLPAASIGLRDSQAPEAGHLTVDRATIAALFAQIKTGNTGLV